uniref:Uncharacterized protein n=1 Tax=Ixodes ricinus TaxID=34613 RepID=A0A6B0V5C8_IXORI
MPRCFFRSAGILSSEPPSLHFLLSTSSQASSARALSTRSLSCSRSSARGLPAPSPSLPGTECLSVSEQLSRSLSSRSGSKAELWLHIRAPVESSVALLSAERGTTFFGCRLLEGVVSFSFLLSVLESLNPSAPSSSETDSERAPSLLLSSSVGGTSGASLPPSAPSFVSGGDLLSSVVVRRVVDVLSSSDSKLPSSVMPGAVVDEAEDKVCGFPSKVSSAAGRFSSMFWEGCT